MSVKRETISSEYKWKLEDIYATDEEWEKDFSALSKNINLCKKYKGKLKDKKSVIECLTTDDTLGHTLERLYVYASMRHDEDGAVEKYSAMKSRIEMLSVKMSEITSFIVPELTALDSDLLISIAESEEGYPFRYSLKELVRSKDHVLSAREEELLAGTGSFSGDFRDIFGMFDNVDVKFGDVKDGDEKVTVTHGTYSKLLQSRNRDTRRKAYRKMFGAYKDHIYTLTAVYAGNVKKNVFYAKTRKYPSVLARALDGDDISTDVYDSLIKSLDEHTPYMHEYVALRKEALGLENMAMYDMYVPIVEGAELAVEYEDACKTVKAALSPLGEEYSKLLDEAFTKGWIDVYENKGKRSGAYSWGTYGVHPYVLLNYNKTTHDVFTIAHELGHAMHSYYSNKNNPHSSADYAIFVAEIASTVNEVLLIKYLLKNTSDKALRKYLLSYYLDMFRTTVFRQTMFSEFERYAHGLIEKGDAITPQKLCKYYLKLNRKYYGKSVRHDQLISYEWARIPHFYRAFYVYKYATGMISAVSIASRILEDKSALDGYKKFLSAGGSMSPLDILKLAGVDLTKRESFDFAMKEFRWALDMLKKEL